MTRGSIPRFDLYEELEISPSASAEVVEAAYKALVKRHHPDVSNPDDAQRIKRLNLAREWLVSPTKRRRFDDANGIVGEHRTTVRKPERSRRAETRHDGPRDAPSDAPRARPSSPASFGPNSGEVRQFLGQLRELRGTRALELIEARKSLDLTAAMAARSAALAATHGGRHGEWTFAREAASVIVNGKLSGSPLSSMVATIVADIAGAIVVRDLLPAHDFEVMLTPWTRRDEQATKAGAPVPRSVTLAGYATVAGAAARRVAARVRRDRVSMAASGGVLAGALAVAMLAAGMGNRPEAAVAAMTSQPSSVDVFVPPSVDPTATAVASVPGLGPIAPSPTASTETQGPVFVPATPRPATPTARPTERPAALPTPTPPPVPSPTPVPTPTPVSCQVISLIGISTRNAQQAWNSAGFSGTVVFSPPTPPQYKIGWQSLTAGASVPCTADVSVQKGPPGP